VPGLLADFRHALRVYARTPFASAIAVLALAVAMAFVSAFLSLWNDLALQPHPGFEDSGRLVTVALSDGDTMAGTSIALMEDMSENIALVEGVTTDQRYFPQVIIDDVRMQVPSETVVWRYFPVLRPRMHIGRGFEPADHEPDAEPVVVLAYDFWQRHYGGRLDVLGEQMGIEVQSVVAMFATGGVAPRGRPEPEMTVYQHQIVGVLEPGMKGTFQSMTELYFPFEQVATRQFPGTDGEEPGMAEIYENMAGLTGVGRLAPGATVEALQAELDRRYTAENYPLIAARASQGMRLRAIPGVHLDLKARRDGLQQVNLFLGGTFLLALVAGANVSLFLLSRAPGRRRELAIRTALGATSRRLVRQLFSESALIVAGAAVLGLLVSLWLVAVLRDLPLFTTVRWRDVSPINWRVLGILATLSLLLVAMVSLAPIAGLRRSGVGAASRQVSARAGLGQALAGNAQLVAAGVLGAVAVAFGTQLIGYMRADPGFETDDVLVLRPEAVTLTSIPAIEDFQARQIQEARVRDIVAGLPGIDDVAFSSSVPSAAGTGSLQRPRAELAPGSTFGDGEEQVEIALAQVSPNLPEFLGMRFLHGSSFADASAGDVLVNESAALALWGRSDVVGERVALFGSAGGEIVGVLRDVYFGHPREGLQPTVFRAEGSNAGMMLVRTSLSPRAIRRLIEERVDSGELETGVATIERLDDVWGEVFAQDRLRLWLTLSGAGITLLLAAFGAYGTQRYLVAAGRREYAIRAALGANPRALRRLVLRRGLELCLPGAGFGLVLAALTASLLRDSYFADAASVPVVTAATTAALLCLIVGATIGPARHAMRTEPAPLLRED
jgi:predicted permease